MTEQNIVPFDFEGKSIRVVTVDGEPWFVGKDVAERLGYADATSAMKQHCRGVVKRHPITDALGREQKARILSEPDVLRLIVGSKLPAAERFERWVFEEVLPAVRKVGGYMVVAPDETPEALALRALTVLQATVERQKLQLAEAMPKVAALDRIATADGDLTITEAAKALGVRPKDLFLAMQSRSWIYKRPGAKNWLGYQTRVQAGLLTHKVNTISRSDGSEKIVEQVLVTPKGLTKLAQAEGIH